MTDSDNLWFWLATTLSMFRRMSKNAGLQVDMCKLQLHITYATNLFDALFGWCARVGRLS